MKMNLIFSFVLPNIGFVSNDTTNVYDAKISNTETSFTLMFICSAHVTMCLQIIVYPVQKTNS